jgi:hypothetical protein
MVPVHTGTSNTGRYLYKVSSCNLRYLAISLTPSTTTTTTSTTCLLEAKDRPTENPSIRRAVFVWVVVLSDLSFFLRFLSLVDAWSIGDWCAIPFWCLPSYSITSFYRMDR